MRRALKGVVVIALAAGALGVTATVDTLAAPGGRGNSGDVWLDNVGNPPGPGHQSHPHLQCADLNIWGAKLAESGGDFAIDGWPPSGHHEQVYAARWAYALGQPDPQVVGVVNVDALIASAVAHGDQPHANQGFHFKLELSQAPQKHKVFWVNCPVSSPAPSPAPAPEETPAPPVTPPPTSLPTPGPAETATPRPEATPALGPTPTPRPLPITLAPTGRSPVRLLLALLATALAVIATVWRLLLGRK